MSESRPRLPRYRLTMAVHLTRIYTRTGDDGTTGLSDFSRVSKNDARLAAYADCDETNAAIGVAVALGNPDEQIRKVLRQIQNDLFDAGADLSTPVVEKPEHPPLRIDQSYIDRLESWCDEFNEPLPALNSFVLPAVHRCRRYCTWPARWRAELSARHGGRWRHTRKASTCLPAKYLNRLSDLLFILCESPIPAATCCGNPAVPQRIRPFCGGAPRRRPRLQPRLERRQVHRDPGRPHSRGGVPGSVSRSSRTTIASVMMSNSSPRGDRRDTISRPRRLSRRSGHHRRLDSR